MRATGVRLSSVALKALALLVFLGGIAAATYGVQQQLGGGDVGRGAGLRFDAARAELNATPGHDVTFVVVVQNRGSNALDVVVRAEGDGAEGASPTTRVPAAAQVAAFVTVDVPDAIGVGEHALDVRLEAPDGGLLRQREDALTLRILGDAPGFGDGTTASLLYVGRFADSGRVFNTNDPVLIPLSFPKADDYQASEGALPVEGGAGAGVVEGFYEGLVGIQPGESRTFTIPPEKAYGNATEEQEVDRVERLDREFDLALRTDSVARATFDEYMTETSQGAKAAGEFFVFEQGPNRWPYRVVSIDEQDVEYRLAVEPGQSYTLYPFWTNASEVVAVNDTHAKFRTTPQTPVGETFTMRSYWPNMTRLESVGDEEIVVRHSPTVGMKYTEPATQVQAEREVTVKEVRDDAIVLSTPSTNPLAGRTLTFDVLALSLTQ